MNRDPMPDWLTGWHVDEARSQSGYITIKDRDRRTVARVPFDVSSDPHDLDRARLICAAPKLDQAVRAMLARWESLNVENLGPGCRAIADEARAALAIAEGRTT